jgi:hypothetical protein
MSARVLGGDCCAAHGAGYIRGGVKTNDRVPLLHKAFEDRSEQRGGRGRRGGKLPRRAQLRKECGRIQFRIVAIRLLSEDNDLREDRNAQLGSEAARQAGGGVGDDFDHGASWTDAGANRICGD